MKVETVFMAQRQSTWGLEMRNGVWQLGKKVKDWLLKILSTKQNQTHRVAVVTRREGVVGRVK